MPIDRRSMIKAIGAALCAGAVPKFVPELVGGAQVFGFDMGDPNDLTGFTTVYTHYEREPLSYAEQNSGERLPDPYSYMIRIDKIDRVTRTIYVGHYS